jgi:transglutaminase-like putative cysteine protease
MRRRRAIASLGAAACTGLLLSGACATALPLACLAVILFDAAWLAPRRRRPGPRVLLALQILLVIPFGYLALLKNPPIDFLTLLLVLAAPLVVLRSLSAESDFNDFLILLLSLLLVVGSAAVAPGPLPVAITALYVLVGCQALSVMASRRGEPEPRVRFRLERPLGWWAMAPTLAVHHLGMGGLLLGVFLYLVAPRPGPLPETDALPGRMLGAGSGGREGRTTAARAGFPQDVRIGDIGKIKRRPYVALQLEIRALGRPYDPRPDERSALLLRARAWERYLPAARRWERSQEGVRPLPPGGLLEPGEGELDWSFQILGYDGKTLFLPPRSRRVRPVGGDLVVDRLGTVTSSVPVLEYAVMSARPVRPGDLPALAPDLRDRQLVQVPDAAARALLPHLPEAPRGDVAAAAAAIAEFFRSNDFRYTLDLPPAIDAAPDPLVAFLETREGDCELYATTACLFLRLLGVPARVAGGLRCAERLGPGRYQARFSNAHAWVEVPCREVGYVALDFTPPDDAAKRPTGAAGPEGAEEAGGAAGGEEALLDWRDPFAYGAEEQERVLDWLKERLLDWRALALLAGFLLFLVFPSAVAAAKNRPKDPLRVTAPEGQKRSTLAFYARWLRERAAEGYVRGRAQTPREFLAALPPETRAEGALVTEEFERRRYGPPGPP